MISPRFRETDASRLKLRDLSNAAHVRAALRHDERTRKLDIAIECSRNQVTLSGVADSEPGSTHAAETAVAMPGVSGVANQIKSPKHAHHRFDS